MKTLFALPIFLFVLLGCSHGLRTTKILSFPEGASVGIKDREGRLKTLGQTPLETQISDPITAVVISKDGFQDQQLMLIGASDSQVEVSAKLIPKAESSREIESASRLEKLARELVSAHNLMTQKRLPEAQVILMSLTREFPSVSVTYDLLGNIAYLQKDSPKALEYYERSLRINPENIETRNMISRLKGNL